MLFSKATYFALRYILSINWFLGIKTHDFGIANTMHFLSYRNTFFSDLF